MKSLFSKLLVGTVLGLNKIVLAAVLVLAVGTLLLDLGLIGNGQSPLTTIFVVYAIALVVLVVATLIAKAITRDSIAHLVFQGAVSILAWAIIGFWLFGWPDNFSERHLGIYSLASGLTLGFLAGFLGRDPKPSPPPTYTNGPNGSGAGVGVR